MIQLIKKYKQGAEIYYCGECKHNFTIPKNKKRKDIKCYYCGQKVKRGL